MLGKSHWFQRRKYTGWGLTPSTWQGWIYLLVAIALIMLTQVLPVEETFRTTLMFGLIVILVLDIIDIMRKLPLDERERIHEAVAERNALYAILATLAAGIGWQAYQSALYKTMQVDPLILAALLVGTAAKAISNIYLDRKN